MNLKSLNGGFPQKDGYLKATANRIAGKISMTMAGSSMVNASHPKVSYRRLRSPLSNQFLPHFFRTEFMKRLLVPCLTLFGAATMALGQPAINIGDRVELFTDNYLIDQLSGDAKKVLQKPEPQEVVFTADAPWEGNISANFGLFQDGDTYRMYYRGGSSFTTQKAYHDWRTSTDKQNDPYPLQVACVAESKDGIHWTRPDLGIVERDGSKKNNILLESNSEGHNFAAFKDENPKATPEMRYKGIAGKGNPQLFKSADGFHWEKIGRSGVKEGTFDSHNLAFWDSVRQEYRMYWRLSTKLIRGIRTATSKDFVTWENEQNLTYPGIPEEGDYKKAIQFYTNAVQPYFRAPHIFIGFPTQFILKGELTQPLFMSSRDGVAFDLWTDPVIPTTAPKDRDAERSNYMAWGVLHLPGKPDEISVYAKEAYRKYGPVRLRRFTYRLDGFVSISAGADGGEMVTKPLIFTGKELVVNYKVRSGGSLRMEIQDKNGKVLKDFRLEDSEPLTGDSTKAVAKWKGNSDLTGVLSDESVRIRFVLKDADIYSIKL